VRHYFLMGMGLMHGALALAQTVNSASALSEQDFLAEMPIVLSVSRLAQRLDETPGAVTILDKSFIHMSGARDVADLLRMVPGFQTTTTFETDAQLASYHGRNDDWSNRIQVLVDGRSVYVGLLQGSTGMGLQTIAINDIERIEILRGSNSAAYGARAFLGVINIVSKDVRDTLGVSIDGVTGENGVGDAGARIGWGTGDVVSRISADTRRDDGLTKVFQNYSSVGSYATGANRVNRLNYSSHVSVGGGTDVEARVGGLEIEANRGTGGPGNAGNLERLRYMGSDFLQLDLHTVVSETQDFALSFSHTEDFENDAFPYLVPPSDPTYGYNGIKIDFSGHDINDALNFQETNIHSESLRTVWGAELRNEYVNSDSQFVGLAPISTTFLRLFGNAEWRMKPNWILNAGGLVENSSDVGESFSPRLMLNWHVTPQNTLRAGVSTAFRTPSAYERYANVVYYDNSGANPFTTVVGNPSLKSEQILTRELGYAFNFAAARLEGDLRVFNENISDGIAHASESPALQAYPGCQSSPGADCYLNSESDRINGFEYQLNWRPTQDTRVYFSQSYINIDVLSSIPDIVSLLPRFNIAGRTQYGAPKNTSSLMIMQSFPGNWSASVIYSDAHNYTLMSSDPQDPLVSATRTDLRLAKRLQLGRERAEVAFLVQDLNGPYRDGDIKFFFNQRAMVSLNIEY